jgi:hypothetical protein
MWLFLREKPLECEVSVYCNFENALAENPSRAFDWPASASKLEPAFRQKRVDGGQSQWAGIPIGETARGV